MLKTSVGSYCSDSLWLWCASMCKIYESTSFTIRLVKITINKFWYTMHRVFRKAFYRLKVTSIACLAYFDWFKSKIAQSYICKEKQTKRDKDKYGSNPMNNMNGNFERIVRCNYFIGVIPQPEFAVKLTVFFILQHWQDLLYWFAFIEFVIHCMPSGMSLIDSTLTRSLSILIGHWSIQEVTDPAYKLYII